MNTVDEIELNYERAPRTILCPMDGAPLASFRRVVNEPSVFVHRDGTRHSDGLDALMAARPHREAAPTVSVPSLPDWASGQHLPRE